MNNVFKKIESLKIIPVLSIKDLNKVDPLKNSLLEGGLPCIEITFRTKNAIGAIKKMAETGDILVGAGTVLTKGDAKAAVDAGAKFIVSPGLDPEIVEFCIDKGIAIAPGVCTPTDITIALNFGLKVLKFFPAEASGGIATIEAMGAPFSNLKFIPTGGIKPSNILDYLNSPKVIACGGSWLVKSELIEKNEFKTITKLISEAVALTEKSEGGIYGNTKNQIC